VVSAPVFTQPRKRLLDKSEMQTMVVEAIKWVLKLVDADVTPRVAR
jgi:hypothetical protein